jgi:Squalene-hopene cyclase C-terminal domain
MLTYSKLRLDKTVRERAKRMLDWLVSIQFPDGAFQGGNVYAQPRVATVFNTGQILLGLSSGVREFGEEYREPMCKAVEWLVNVQDSDGCWRKYDSPFVVPGEKVYNTHVAWALLEAARLEPDKRYVDAALANVRWALSQQTPNGWFRQCCLNDPVRPLTHTLAYALRGILEAYRFTRDPDLLSAGRKTADGFQKAMRKDGFISGRLLSDWRGAVNWACLTGTVQIAYCWLLLFQFTRESRYRDSAYTANRYVRRIMHAFGAPREKGGVKGAFPVDGAYHDFNYVSWACKFFVDGNILEKEIREQTSQWNLDSSAS